MLLRLIMRFLALSALALAVISFVIDATRSIGTSKLVVTSVGQSWATLSPQSLDNARAYVEAHGLPGLWDPGITSALAAPTAAVLGVLALLFYMMGYRREERRARFALR